MYFHFKLMLWFNIRVGPLRGLPFTDSPWANLCFRIAERIQTSTLKWHTFAQLCEQSNQPHLVGFYCHAAAQLSHIIPHLTP